MPCDDMWPYMWFFYLSVVSVNQCRWENLQQGPASKTYKKSIRSIREIRITLRVSPFNKNKNKRLSHCSPNSFTDSEQGKHPQLSNRSGSRVDWFLFSSSHHICPEGISWWWRWQQSWSSCLQPVIWHWRWIRTEQIHTSSPKSTNCCIGEAKEKQKRVVLKTL